MNGGGPQAGRSRKPPLPRGVRIIGWTGLLAGGLGLLGSAAVLAWGLPPLAKGFIGTLSIAPPAVGCGLISSLSILASVGLLLGREWGRKATVVSLWLWLLGIAAGAGVVTTLVRGFLPPGALPTVLVCVASLPGVTVVMGVLMYAKAYLGSREVRRVFGKP